MEIRRNDYSLTPNQVEIRDLFRRFLGDQVPRHRVRAAEPLGFDAALWRSVAELGAVAVGLPEIAGGAGLGLVELNLIAEEYGAVLAPVPLIEAMTVARLLQKSDAEQFARVVADIAAGGRIVTLALADGEVDQLVPVGAIADAVIALDGEELVIYEGGPAGYVPNQGSIPLGWWRGSQQSRTLVASGSRARDLYEGACNEWRLLTAAALVGLASGALSMAIEYAKSRHAFGGPIGRFQAVSHSLVDAATAIEGARNLCRKAAWFRENEPHSESAIPAMAFVCAGQAATRAVTTSVHVHGGSGYMLETDVTLYFRRAKAWSVIGGEPNAEFESIARHVFEQSATHSSVLS
jgi:alkylation response protein AidB-like acyl-CoA dehydrogenase